MKKQTTMFWGIFSVMTLLASLSYAGGDQRFSSGEVSYNGQFPEVGAVKKAHEFPSDDPGPLSPFIPKRLLAHADVQPLADGFIDVTQAPYSVKADGKTDVTQALQNAIDDAYLCRMIVYFPAGTYLVSDQLKCYRPWNQRWSHVREGQNPNGKRFSRLVGHELFGPETGAPAIIKLKDGAKVQDDILIYFLQYDMDGKLRDRSNYCNTLRNLEIDLGNNPTVCGVKMDGAQYSSVEDVHIYGKSFHAGFCGIPGSGGSMTNIKVTGGKVGILEAAFRPSPIAAGVELLGQSECAVQIKDSRGAVTLCGFRIEGPDSPDYCAIKLESTSKSIRGCLMLVDGTIQIAGENGLAIQTTVADFALRNVSIQAASLVEFNGQRPTALQPGKWNHVERYGFSDIDAVTSIRGKNKFSDHLYAEPITIQTPTTDWVAHHGWGEMPAWDKQNYVNVVTEYGATPSFGLSKEYLSKGGADDVGIQQAIDDVNNPDHANFGKTVFIPHGDYRITKPLFVKASTHLMGAGKASTVLQQAYEVWEDPSQPVLITEDTADGNIILSDFYICSYPRGRFYDIRSGNTIIRSLQTHVLEELGTFPEAIYPYATFSGHASGKVYNLCSDHVSGYDEIRKGVSSSGDYSLLKIENGKSEQPLCFYQASIEHLAGDKAQVIVENAGQVYFYSYKHEPGPGKPLMTVNNSKGVSIFASSGHYGLQYEDHPAIIAIENTPNIEMVMLSRQEQKKELKDGLWISNGADRIDDDHPVFWYIR